MTARPPSARRALSHTGGPTRTAGAPDEARWLKAALEAAEGAPADEHVHGFHAYPARMHPAVSAAVLAAVGDELDGGRAVLDPFCGSGTTLVEARLAGRAAVGTDLNPLAVRLARLKSAPPPAEIQAEVGRAAEQVVQASCARVKAKSRVRAPLGKADAALYPPHVLLELAGLRAEVRAVGPGPVGDALELVFSAMVTKFSHLGGETGGHRADKRIGRFVPSRFFGRKAAELVERWSALGQRLPAGAPSPVVIEADARSVAEALPAAGAPDVGAVVTSPPYGGTYDYREHHRLRALWLGLDDSDLERSEIGARRRSRGKKAPRRWDLELGDVLRGLAAVLPAGAPVVLLSGDGELAGERVAADEQLRRLATQRGLAFVAAASQRRPDWRRGPDREEHLVLLRVGGG